MGNQGTAITILQGKTYLPASRRPIYQRPASVTIALKKECLQPVITSLQIRCTVIGSYSFKSYRCCMKKLIIQEDACVINIWKNLILYKYSDAFTGMHA